MNNRCLMLFFLSALLSFVSSDANELYDFKGHHLVASYMNCNKEALTDISTLEQVMEKAVEASGATVLSSSKHVFPENGLTLGTIFEIPHPDPMAEKRNATTSGALSSLPAMRTYL